MIQTYPRFINGDNFRAGQYFNHILKDNNLIYSSVWTWWRKTTVAWGSVSLAAGLLIFVFILPQELQSQKLSWPIVISMIPIPLIVFMPLVWVLSYFSSFISPNRYRKKIKKFIKTSVPGANDIKELSPTNFIFSRNEIEYEVAYPVVSLRTNANRYKRQKKYFAIATYFHQIDDSIANNIHPDFLEAFITEWHEYFKTNCEDMNLAMDNYAIHVSYDKKSMPSREVIEKALDFMQEMIERLEIFAIYATEQSRHNPDIDPSLITMPNMN